MVRPETTESWTSIPTTNTAIAAAPSAVVKTVELYHELGSEPEDQTAERLVHVAEGSPSTTVHIKSHVLARGAKALKSPQYLATIRRREARKVAARIEALAHHAENDQFAAWTHKPLETLRALLCTLTEAEQFADAEHEGNSCEVLRQLRDSFLNRGWERYREPAVRDAAVDILRRLAAADEVSADEAYRSMDQLLDLGLDPTVGMVSQHGEEEEVPH